MQAGSAQDTPRDLRHTGNLVTTGLRFLLPGTRATVGPVAAGDEVWIERRKWPDSPHYGTLGVVLGGDEHGTWVGARPGSLVVMPDGTERRGEWHAVWCVPHDDWFLLHVWHGHPEVHLYIDICTPPVWNDRGARMIDLDFDVVVWNAQMGGHVELVDEDEFEQHRVELAYPADLVERARRAATDVLTRVQRAQAPFSVEASAPWLRGLVQGERP